MAAVGGLLKEFCDEATCSVCLEYFTDPVIAECGHNFCRACLTQSSGGPGRNASCPECREPLQQSSLRPNRKLASFAEISKKVGLPEAKGAGGAGGGVCETHQEPLSRFCTDDRAPICVVCEKSKEHRQHRVIPNDEAAEKYKAVDGSAGLCETHQKPLKLFCVVDEASLCVLCDPSKKHKEHQVIPAEEVVEEYKEKIQAQLQSLEKKRENLVKRKTAEEQRSQECLKQLEEEKQEILSVFKGMHQFLEEKERFWLTALSDLEKQMKKRQEENISSLSKEISHFSNLIKDLEGKCQQPVGSFMQDIKGTLSRCLAGQKRWFPELSSGLEWRFKSDSLKTSLLKEVMEEFEGCLRATGSLKRGLNKVSVTLASDTAFNGLTLSADWKSVSSSEYAQNLPNNPKRFDSMPGVLGCERFSSGRHCWEVELLSPGDLWAVGVARDTVKRKGQFALDPNKGIWAVSLAATKPHAVIAHTLTGKILVTSGSHDLRKIRVFLDYEEGRVEFFNADTGNWIFSFPPASFSGEEIRPLFLLFKGVSMKC